MTGPLLDGLVARALDPTPDQARAALRRELLRPEYQDRNVVRRILDALQHLIDSGVATASALTPLQTLAALVVLLLVAGGVGRLVSRARRAGATRAVAAAVLADDRLSADDLRARAEAALTRGRYAEALVDGFRALARREVETGRLPDDPGATATEVAAALSALRSGSAAALRDAARTFDAVVYGDRPATREQARAVLALDGVGVA